MIEAVNDLVGFPLSVALNMKQSSSLDGVSTYENQNYFATWAFLLDRGLEVFYELK